MEFIETLSAGTTAVRYGTPDGKWEKDALVKIAAFATDINLDKNAITQDQMMDVVRPVERFWDPSYDIADIEVITGKRILGMTLGQWLVRYQDGFFRVLSNNAYLSQVGPTKPALSFRQELQQLLNKHSIDAKVGMTDFLLAKHVDSYLDVLAKTMLLNNEYKELA